MSHFSRLEDERYSNSMHKEWLCLSELVKHSSEISDSESRIFEPLAHFQLLLALIKLKYLWANEQHSDDFLVELRFILGKQCRTLTHNFCCYCLEVSVEHDEVL